ncbi:related to trimethyllysine hydroxylase [Moesziomyces antarcticus]|uniref:trimethyllysine dioxygenase n=1 Tax=Pseudozyma antarctica TaxID=84753 RepID=A0A5C3FS99_PSEA2|nr:related to trimethyllysine hydroxylase [Moesziomyces antarcticus]
MYRPLPRVVSALPKRLTRASARSVITPCRPAIASSVPSHSVSIGRLLSTSRASRAEAAAKPAAPTASSSASASYSDGGPAVPGVTTDAKSRAVYITWASGITSKFHNIWLRDHCRCPQCYHPTTKQRLLNTFEIAPDAQPISAEATTEGLLVHWPLLPSERAAQPAAPEPAQGTEEAAGESAAGPQHPSLYPWRWLMRNSYSPLLSDPVTAASDDTGLKGIEKVLWGKGIGSAPPTVRYDEVMGSDEGVLKWVTKIVSLLPTTLMPRLELNLLTKRLRVAIQAQYGFAFVSGVPPTPTDTEALIRRIAFIRETHYGGFWDFTSDLAHGDTAYTDLALQAHTDTTYFTDPAGLQMFHLLSHTASKTSASGTKGPSGGESLLVDGFLAAAVLKDVHPEAYDTLSRVRIRTHSAGDENTMIRPLLDGGYPILQHDEATGELVLVRYNNDDRSVLRIDADDVEPFYDALTKWNAILTNPEGEYRVQLKPGTPLIFDNHRVLHGRAAFVGNRRLCGAYVNHDDYRSRLAVLRTQLAENRSTRGVWDDGL